MTSLTVIYEAKEYWLTCKWICNKQIFTCNNNGSHPQLVLLNSTALFLCSKKYQASSNPLQGKRDKCFYKITDKVYQCDYGKYLSIEWSHRVKWIIRRSNLTSPSDSFILENGLIPLWYLLCVGAPIFLKASDSTG